MQFPRTLLEFQAQFPDDAHCWAYQRRTRWPRGSVCPRCGGRGSHFLAGRRLEQCRGCRYQSSITAGTVFHATRALQSVKDIAIAKSGVPPRELVDLGDQRSLLCPA
jgi:hypothetical protein